VPRGTLEGIRKGGDLVRVDPEPGFFGGSTSFHRRLHAAFMNKRQAVHREGCTKDDVESASWFEMPGKSWRDIRSVEQDTVDLFGGVGGGTLLNRNNPMAR
jgi:hypothetical protein